METVHTAAESTSGLTPRRGVQLPPIQTTFTQKPSQRLQRPRPVQQVIITSDCQTMPPVERVALGRKTSKGGLFGLFGRNKSYRNPRPEAVAENVGQGEITQPSKDTAALDGAIPISTEAETPVGKPSIGRNTGNAASTEHTTLSANKQRPAKSATRTKSFRKEPTTWDPPPLFQAYPQSIKHSLLSAPTASADAILRHYRITNSHESTHSQPSTKSDDAEKKARGDNKRQKSQEAILNGTWVQKIYILVTSGYMLQYAGDGNFDRLPEKIMPLGKDSAAFASDVIPGKPWVLRICQEALEDNDVPPHESGSVFKKLTFRNETKRPASNFLLVMGSPEDMNEWLVVVRKEIEALGGKQYRPDIPRQRSSSEVQRALSEKPSRRFLIKRDPNQFAEREWEPVPGTSSPLDTDPELGPKDLERRPIFATRKSIDSPSVCNTTISTEQGTLERLKETPRMSYASNAKTLSTSPGSSPSQSPVRADRHINGCKSVEAFEDCVTPKPQRASIYGSNSPPTTQRTSSDGSNSRPASNYSRSSLPESTSPPHFSVPSYSKRYSMANNRISRIASPPSTRSSTIQEVDPPVHERDGDDRSDRRTSVLGELQSTTRTSPKGSKSLGNLAAHFNPPPPMISFATESSPGEIISSKRETTVPRRFSSLAYSRGISPIRDISDKSPTPPPHPPPTSALPAIPATPALLSPNSHRHSIQPFSSPDKRAQNLRRPISMQVRTRSTFKVDEETFDIVSKQPFQADFVTTSSTSSTMPELTMPASNVLSMNAIPTPPTRSAPPPPPSSSEPEIPNGNMLPHTESTSSGKPSQLPRLPSIRVSRKGFRGSLEGPWSTTYANERSYGVRAN